MKVTYNWLKKYVHFDWSAEELAERLTMIGLEVEGVETIQPAFDKVVVARIISSDPHPDADRLSVCRVQDGPDPASQRQIVCGAKNFKVGDRVPLALPGCIMPAAEGEKPFVIKPGKLRGVESQGMMCSGKELGASEDSDGLWILPETAEVGAPLSRFLGLSDEVDVVYDLEVTPNRPDLNSVIGIAREISALNGYPLEMPLMDWPTDSISKAPTSSKVKVVVEDREKCPRYTARYVEGIKVGPSPEWLKSTLEKVGLRSINNVVDVTNYVMLETGQPLHAFDARQIDGTSEGPGSHTIKVRCATEGEKFVTLDGVERQLSTSDLLIADSEKAIALAGVMGGENSEVSDTTQALILESACFQPQCIRATSKSLNLRTDASYRFERGADPGAPEWVSRRAIQLILETAGGTAYEGVVDSCPIAPERAEITLRHARTDALLGISIPIEDSVGYLRRLQMDVLEETQDHVKVLAPTFRVDLKREVDLIEEVARLFGVDNIPSTAPKLSIGENAFDSVFDQIDLARRILEGVGFNETQGQTLIGRAAAAQSTSEASVVSLAHPLSSEMDVLRPSILPGTLDIFGNNARKGHHTNRFYEIGRVFVRDAEGKAVESLQLALSLSGKRSPGFWSGAERDAEADVFDLKGALDEFLERFGVFGIRFQAAESVQDPEQIKHAFFIESAELCMGKQVVGRIGTISPWIQKDLGVRHPIFMAELDLDCLLKRRAGSRSFKSLPNYPAVQRDIAMFVDESESHDSILKIIQQAKAPFLESVELFDVFRGETAPAGQRSVAYELTYRSPDKTLKDSEVQESHEKVLKRLRESIKGVIRE